MLESAKEQNVGRIGILGNGSWGTALAKMLTDNGQSISWWLRNVEAVDHLNSRHHNPHYLTSVSFNPDSIRPTSDLEAFWESCDTIVFAIPSAYAGDLLDRIDTRMWQRRRLVSAIKGILPQKNLLLSDYLEQHHGFDLNNYVAITGPCHAEEVAAERLSYLTFSGLNDRFTEAVSKLFATEYLRTSYNHDLWGAQFAAVLKNIYAIGAGIAHGLDYGDNFLSVYTTACYREMYHFLDQHFEKVHPSDERPDFHTSAYLGDLLVTCYSLHSRNRTFGNMLGKGYTVKAAILGMNMVAEGYYASRGMQFIASQHGIATPIADMLYNIMWEHAPAKMVFSEMEKHLS